MRRRTQQRRHKRIAKPRACSCKAINENKNQATSSAEYLVTQVKNHKFIHLTFSVLLMAGIGFGIYSYSDRAPINNPFESVKITANNSLVSGGMTQTPRLKLRSFPRRAVNL